MVAVKYKNKVKVKKKWRWWQQCWFDIWYVDSHEYGLLLLKFPETHTQLSTLKKQIMFYWSHGEQNTKLHSLFQTMPQLYKSLLIRAIRDQCRRVVTFFWWSTKCHRETVQMGKPKMKLIQEMETWWNCMFFHASKIIRRTWNGANLTSLNTNIMLLDNGQFEVISQCLHALSSFNHTSEQVIQWNFGEKTKQ